MCQTVIVTENEGKIQRIEGPRIIFLMIGGGGGNRLKWIWRMCARSSRKLNDFARAYCKLKSACVSNCD